MCPRSSPAALPAEAGWGAVKRSRRWKPGLHRHCPGFCSRREPPAPDLTYAQDGSSGCRCEPGVGSRRAGKRQWKHFLPEARAGEGSGLSTSTADLWIAGVVSVPSWPGGYRQSLDGAGGCPHLYLPPIGIRPLRDPRGLEPQRGCHPSRPFPRALQQELGWTSLTSACTMPL